MRRKDKMLVIILVTALFIGVLPYGTKQTTSKATGYGISNPRVERDDTVTWDCIYFGNYWQNDTNGDGVADQNDEKEPIKWRVLSVDGDDAFLLADQGLDAKAYNNVDKDVVWANTPLRKWLNDEFYNIAFASSEQGSIVETDATNEDGNCVKDKVSLLSLTEACNAKYGFNFDSSAETETRKVKVTEYAKANGAFTYEGIGNWWLRSYYDFTEKIYWTLTLGYIRQASNFFAFESDKVVRPCIHLNLSTNAWSKADAVTATGGTFATPTPVITPTPTPTITPTPTPTNYYSYPTSIAIVPPIKATPTPTPKPKTVKAPAKPTKFKVKNNKKKSATLSWKKVKDAKGYQLQYATNDAFSSRSKTTKKTKITIKKLKRKKTYSFRVRAYVLDDKRKVYGKWSRVKRIKIRK